MEIIKEGEQQSEGEDLSIWLSEQRVAVNIKPKLNEAKEIAMAINAVKRMFANQSFDPSLEQDRWPSELGLCAYIQDVKLPSGFEVTQGMVKLDKTLPRINTKREIYHTFGYNEDGRILCVTFGQFYNSRKNLRAGERVAYFQKLAPDLVHVYPDQGIAVLLGQKDEIKEKLGLDYILESNGQFVEHISSITP